MKRLILTPVLPTLFLLFTTPAFAELVSIDDAVFGVNSITQDTETGLEWLDLTLTTGLTVSDIQAQQSAGQLYNGFSIATSSDVQTLIENGGWQFGYNTNFQFDAPKFTVAFSLTEMLGQTFTDPDTRAATYGFVSDIDQSDGDNYYDFIFTRESDFTSSAWVTRFASSTASPDRGVWLYRSTAIPEPSSLMLFSIPLIVAAVCRRRRARRN